MFRVFRGKESWVFFRVNTKMQKQILSGESVDLSVRYVGVDKRVIKVITDKLSEDKTIIHN